MRFSWLWSSLGLRKQSLRERCYIHRTRGYVLLRLEQLEDRTLLSTVTWINPNGGNWDTASNWSTGVLPGASDDVIIPVLGSGISVTHSAGTDGVKSVTSDSNIILSGGTLSVTGNLQESTGTSVLLKGGTLANATVTSGSTLALTGYDGQLAGVTIAAGATLDGTQNIGSSQAYTNVTGGLVLNGTADLGSASGNVYGWLVFQGTQTLSGTGSVVFGGSSSNTLYAQGNDGSNPATLTVASSISVSGGSGALSGYYSNDSFINDASINIASGHTLTLKGDNWLNNGTITASADTVNLGGSFITASLGNFSASGSTVNLEGTLNNAGTTLALAPTLGAWYLHGGTISGGTIASTGGSTLALTGYDGQLAGVTIAAGATLDGTQNIGSSQAYTNVSDGLVLNGTADLGSASGNVYGWLVFQGTQTLSGSGTVVFGGSSSNTLYAQGNDGNNPATLTIASSISVKGGSGALSRYYSNDSVVCFGTVEANTSGGKITVGNSGSGTTLANYNAITAGNGATINIPESVQINGSSILTVSPNSSLTVAGNLLGTTQNPALFNPQGTITLNGSGTASSPQLLEAMSADLGSGPNGFINNFAYGTLILSNNTYVKLVNQSVNAPSSSAEAVYANSLVVPTGCTLNLNGLNLYVRDAQIAGTLTGGSITQIPNSGPLTVDSPTPGHLSTAGELDDWTFFERGGHSLTVALDPGSGASGGPISPTLQWAQVQLLDPSGNVLATASSTAVCVTSASP